MKDLTLSGLYFDDESFKFNSIDITGQTYRDFCDLMFDGFIDLATNFDYWVHGEDYDYSGSGENIKAEVL